MLGWVINFRLVSVCSVSQPGKHATHYESRQSTGTAVHVQSWKVWEGRFVHSKHNDDGGWYPVIRQDLIGGIDKDLLAKAQKNPMETVELADGARESTADDSLACGL
eukprot:COSAG01_NODE_33023_length_571_cov_1.197034_1_plen_107_part_00